MKLFTGVFATLLFVYATFAQEEEDTQDQDPVCNAFRITSPVSEELHWTAGQCYQVSYDLSGFDNIGAKVSVELYNSSGVNTKVADLVTEEPANEAGGTSAFKLNVPTSGTYYYLVSLSYENTVCKPKKTVDFQVEMNPNSPPADKC